MRHGTTPLFAALNVATGEVIGQLHRLHRVLKCLAFLRDVNHETPAGLDLHVVMDHSATQKTPQVRASFAGHPRFQLHFIPTPASWLN
ncbi:transposase [Thiocapsa bogorovii]|nr:transposase [Thiocapsa bogorovii]UHD16374.1 transposase [Thiocapsa bogorovii]